MPEQRKEARRNVTLQGAMLPYDSSSVIICMIRDLTEAGARLKMAVRSDVPDTFDLLIHTEDGTVRRKRCTVAWKDGNQVGVSFN